MVANGKFLNVGPVVVATLAVTKLISTLMVPRSAKRLPPLVKGWPVIGGPYWFLQGPTVMIQEVYPKIGSVFTVNFGPGVVFDVDYIIL